LYQVISDKKTQVYFFRQLSLGSTVLIFLSLSWLPSHSIAEYGDTTGVASNDGHLDVVWKVNGNAKQLKRWSQLELKQWKVESRREKDPETQSLETWQGIGLVNLVNIALLEITPDERAGVDLIVLKGRSSGGSRIAPKNVMVPRSYANRFPMLIALSKNGGGLNERGPFYSVVPWSSVPSSSSVRTPVGSLFLRSIHEIVLTNYKDHFGDFFLKRRTNPLAIRGETVFVKTCLGCHALKQTPKFEALAGYDSHGKVNGFPHVSSLDELGLKSYINQYKKENGSGPEIANKFSTRF
jgi:hypothetical protein